jgi:hypothetical protein
MMNTPCGRGRMEWGGTKIRLLVGWPFKKKARGRFALLLTSAILHIMDIIILKVSTKESLLSIFISHDLFQSPYGALHREFIAHQRLASPPKRN